MKAGRSNSAFCFAVLANNVLQTSSVVFGKLLGVLRVMEAITMHSARRFVQVMPERFFSVSSDVATVCCESSSQISFKRTNLG